MSCFRCPPACPLAWSGDRHSVWSWPAFCRHLPANACPVVSPPVLAGRSGYALDVLGGSPSVEECRGVVVCCPLGEPFARPISYLPLRPSNARVPAKEKRNEGPLASAAGGQS
jgi:hypothetical protein